MMVNKVLRMEREAEIKLLLDLSWLWSVVGLAPRSWGPNSSGEPWFGLSLLIFVCFMLGFFLVSFGPNF